MKCVCANHDIHAFHLYGLLQSGLLQVADFEANERMCYPKTLLEVGFKTLRNIRKDVFDTIAVLLKGGHNGLGGASSPGSNLENPNLFSRFNLVQPRTDFQSD